MKKIITIACMLAGISAYAADGTVNFNNYVSSSGINAPIFWIDGTTKLAGTAYLAQLYAGASASTLAAVGDALPFRTGAGAGLINPTGVDTTRTIPGLAAGSQAFVQIRAWDAATGSTYEAALAAGGATGFSSTLTVTTGNAGSPPSLPADLVGLQGFSLQVIPEPSTLALGILGAALLVIRRRK
jgi:hypothetical protein